MLWIELSSVVVETCDCWPLLEPPSPGSEAIEYMDMRFAMLASGAVRRPERDTAESGCVRSSHGVPQTMDGIAISTSQFPARSALRLVQTRWRN
jgi:hypothetical protein